MLATPVLQPLIFHYMTTSNSTCENSDGDKDQLVFLVFVRHSTDDRSHKKANKWHDAIYDCHLLQAESQLEHKYSHKWQQRAHS